ncbi:MAG: flavodoxin [Lachnospiraceae bacterium]
MKIHLIILISLLLLAFLASCSSQTGMPEERTDEEAESLMVIEESSTGRNESDTSDESNILIVYFSRWGNTAYPEDVDATTSASIVVNGETFGTTEYVARLIQKQVGGDLLLIQTMEKYPTDFDALRELNHREMAEDYLPPLMKSDLDISQYNTVFIGYPVWSTDVPQAVLSFLAEYDLAGKTVIPFCTHGGYGAGNSYETIREASNAAQSPQGLDINAENVSASELMVQDWLDSIGF